ncbi:MAG: hypothetical protein ACFFBV_04385 [Promethearchaeota archaeon]
MLVLMRVYYPPNQGSKVGEKFIEWMKDHPPDPSISKVLSIGVGSTESGDIMVIGISEVVKGKENEAMERAAQQNFFLANEVEGFKYKNELIMDYTEAYKIIRMTAPKV